MKIESAVLKRLGPIPFWRGEKKCLDELNRIYRKAKMFAQEAWKTLPCRHLTERTAVDIQ